jgi:hypothetical protein
MDRGELGMEIEFIGDRENPMAILVKANASVEGIDFFTPESFSQQLGLMSRKKGYLVPAHSHNRVSRTISQTQEVLLLRKGRILVTIFGDDLSVASEIEMTSGDVILLAHGGHKIEMLEDSEILEVKQGPYAGPNDKTHFEVAPK